MSVKKFVVSIGLPSVLALATSALAQSTPPFTMIETTNVHPLGDIKPGRAASGDLGSFNLVIVPGSGLSSNPAALAAFNRAAQQWASLISDPITVTINANLSTTAPGGGTFNPSTIGSTSSFGLEAPYNTIRNAMASDAVAQSPSANNGIINSLPTAAQFTATIPGGRSLSGNVQSTKANLKALNFPGLDAQFGASDAQITFNAAFSFDFDNSNGVGANQIDFETTAAHEIGHALGFSSIVDLLDVTTVAQVPTFSPSALDLFRFSRLGANPSNAANFATTVRNLVPGTDDITDDTFDEYRMSTGQVTGDGRQASHWKDDSLTGTFIGAMDPTLGFATVQHLTYADYRAMDLIGYDLKLWTPGDANHDGSVNFNDLVILAQNYNTVAGATWTNADFTGEGAVNFNDLVPLAQNYGTIPAALLGELFPGLTAAQITQLSLLPEPTSLMCVAAVTMTLKRRRR